MTQGGGIIGIFIAGGNVQHPLFEQIVQRNVDPLRIAWVAEHCCEITREADLVIGVVEQDQTAIGRQPPPIKVDEDRFVA